MPNVTRNVLSLIVAVLITSIIASIFSTQSVISSLQALDIVIPMSARLSMTVSDFGILPALGGITFICFIAGFVVAALCLRFMGGNRMIWHIVAGGSAIISTLLIMKAFFLVTPIAGTRSLLGLLSFGLSGAIGGWVYAKLTTPPKARS